MRQRVVYLYFERKPQGYSTDQFHEAMEYAYDNYAYGARIRYEWTVKNYIPERFLQPGEDNESLPYELCDPVPYIGGAFFADYHTIINFDDLVFVSKFNPHVHLVEYNGVQCVYKFVMECRNQAMFEKEFENYLLLQDGRPEAPGFLGLVRRDGHIRGFLCEHVEGELLCDADFSIDQQFIEWTSEILHSLTVLEHKGFVSGIYPWGI